MGMLTIVSPLLAVENFLSMFGHSFKTLSPLEEFRISSRDIVSGPGESHAV